MDLRGLWKSLKPYCAMVFLQFGFAGMFIISVASMKQGMSHYVLVVYRNAVAAAVIAPFALCFERKVRPKMTFSTFLKIMAMGLLEPVLDQNFYYMGTNNTNASFASALYNVLPAMTFVNAILIGMEKVHIKRRRSQAKVAGTIVTVLGALLMILYKGPVVEFFWNKGRTRHEADSSGTNAHHWIMGVFMLLFSCFCWSAFFLVQSHTLKSYPAELSLTTLICIMGSAQSGAVALVMERGMKPWVIGFDMRLFTVVYSGVMCSGITYYVQGLVMKERGPVFVTAFNPLCMIIVAVLGSIILGDEITLGRVIGAIVIVIGLYSLIWGKSKDHLVQPSDDLPTTCDGVEKSKVLADATVLEMPCAKNP